MARRATLVIKGLDELVEKLNAMGAAVEDDRVEDIYMDGAKIVAEEVERRAPRGPSGNLKTAARAKKLDRTLGRKVRTVISAIDRKLARHAHLVERGTQPRYRKRGRVIVLGASVRKGASTGSMPASPFFYPSIRAKRREVKALVTNGLKDLIEEAMDK